VSTTATHPTIDPIEQVRREQPEALHAWQQRAVRSALGIVLDGYEAGAPWALAGAQDEAA
jgi:hypothetical protein